VGTKETNVGAGQKWRESDVALCTVKEEGTSNINLTRRKGTIIMEVEPVIRMELAGGELLEQKEGTSILLIELIGGGGELMIKKEGTQTAGGELLEQKVGTAAYKAST
jgi:hypothetical protein